MEFTIGVVLLEIIYFLSVSRIAGCSSLFVSALKPLFSPKRKRVENHNIVVASCNCGAGCACFWSNLASAVPCHAVWEALKRLLLFRWNRTKPRDNFSVLCTWFIAQIHVTLCCFSSSSTDRWGFAGKEKKHAGNNYVLYEFGVSSFSLSMHNLVAHYCRGGGI